VSFLTSIVADTAAVNSARNQVLVTEWRVKERTSADSPQVSFTTSGKYPITDTVDESASRLTDLDRRYLDGIIQVTKPLYDWGRSDSLIQVEEWRQLAAVQDYRSSFDQDLGRLLSMTIDVLRSTESAQLIREDLEFIEQTLRSVRFRYSQGAGSLDDVRRLELIRLDLERDLELAKNQQEMTQSTIRQVFSVDIAEITGHVVSAVSILPEPEEIEFDKSVLFGLARSEFEEKATDYEITSVESERKPALTGTITGRFYNILTHPGSEYETYGGLNVDFPIFDGGARDARIQGLSTQKVIQQSQFREELGLLNERWYDLESKLATTRTGIMQETDRVKMLGLRLEALKQRMEAVQVTIVDISEAELARSSAARSLRSLTWSLKQIAVQRAEVADKLAAILKVELP
jgi:outer membrane protein TolC